MAYAPAVDPWAAAIPMGSLMDETYAYVFAEHENTYTTHNTLAASGFGIQSATANDTSKTTNCRWVVFRNTDNVQLTAKIRATATTADCLLTLDYGGASATATVTAGASTTVEINVVPTSSMGGGTTYREAVLSHACAAGGNIKIEGLAAYLEPITSLGTAGGLIHGASSSGFIRGPDGGELVNQTNDHAISTERLERVLNGPIYIARDRPTALASMIRHELDRDLGTTNKTDWVTLARGFGSVLAQEPMDLRAFYHVQSSTGGSPLSRFVFFGDTTSATVQTGTGWKQAAAAEFVANSATPQNPRSHVFTWAIQAKVETAGSGIVFVDSAQIYRDPQS